MTDPKDMTRLVASSRAFALQNSDNTVGKVLNECGDAITTLLEEVAELRLERDALLKQPLDLAEMDSIDDDIGVPDKMVAYYWWRQATEARAALQGSVDRLNDERMSLPPPLVEET
jgi:hypothetical protein